MEADEVLICNEEDSCSHGGDRRGGTTAAAQRPIRGLSFLTGNELISMQRVAKHSCQEEEEEEEGEEGEKEKKEEEEEERG